MDEFITQLWVCEDRLPVHPHSQNTVIDDLDNEPNFNVASSPFEDDVKMLIETYGELCPAKYIEIDLESACSLLHRERHRVDAFSRLIKYLYQNFQTTLKITSRKTH